MPKVTLIDYTGAGSSDPLYAARLLAYTKNTRLNLTPEGWEAFQTKTDVELYRELEYMAGTIPSSWEFVDVTFSIERLSRNTSLQLVRTRSGSYAMQSQRVTDMSEASWDEPSVDFDKELNFSAAMARSVENYAIAVDNGYSLEDARDLLPGGIHTNGIAKYDLRALVELVRKRKSLRVQGYYVSIVEAMEAEVLRVWPWAATFFEPPNLKAIKMIEEVAKYLRVLNAPSLDQQATKLAKAADLLKVAE
jgi:thymidylate synthase ThyX